MRSDDRSARIARGCARLLAAAAVAALAACSGDASPDAKAKAKAQANAVPVAVATVVQKPMAARLRGIGSVEPYATVAVKSRVDGQIMAIHFAEGQNAAQGQLLFEIDPRPFQTQLAQAEANLLRSQAQLQNARAQERRYQELLRQNFVSKEFYAQIRTNLDAAEAAVHADEAAVESARLQFEYSRIRSPIAGRTGKILVQQGNLVKANDAVPLVVINQVSPIYVTFSVPEQDLTPVRGAMASGPLRVQVTLPEGGGPVATGELGFVDNTVDPATGTIKLRATFPNRDQALWPGQFVHAAVTLREQPDALVVPSQAVQTGPKGRYVYVVKADLTVEMREVAVARSEGAETVIAHGVARGERVVTEGQLRLVPGAKVIPENQGS